MPLNIKEIIPDQLYISMQYYHHFHKFLNLNSPKTFNEKLQWMKLYDRNPIYTTMVDKVKAKEYVASIIGEEHIIPTIAVWKDPDEIDFQKLPNQFVIKCNHDSHGVIVVKDKKSADCEAIREKLRNRFNNNGYWYGREWPYKNVEKQILAEKFISDGSEDIADYKIHCFNGKPKFILVCQDRFSSSGLKEDFYDINWNLMDVKRPNAAHGTPIDAPEKMDEMLEFAKKLSSGFPFLRTDFYCVNGKVLFGELTLFPASGMQRFVPDKYDRLFGSWIDLSLAYNNKEK